MSKTNANSFLLIPIHFTSDRTEPDVAITSSRSMNFSLQRSNDVFTMYLRI